jgi:amidase
MESFDRRDFLGIAALAAMGVVTGGRASAQTKAGGFNLEEKTIAELQDAMSKGRITSEGLVSAYIARIRTLDKSLNSVIELNPDAITIARQRDRERMQKRIHGPLHGIPILLKDNIDTADRMKTTAGSLALIDAPAPKQDAFLVEQLRRAGAVILGKTNLSEWANFRDTASSSGWSGRGGQTRNPYMFDRNPCGSSSGSAVAVAANLGAAAIGTETDGSIVCPSSVNGIVGLKPTVGLISRSGVIPISASQDTAGPMTRTVADAAILLSTMTSVDPRDPATSQNTSKARTDYETFLKADGLRGARIGVARDFWGSRPELDKVTNAALDVMKRSGAVLVDVKFPNLRKFDDAEFLVLQYEFKDGLEKYLRERNSQYKTLDDLIKFNNQNAAREMPHFGQAIFESSAKKIDMKSKEYREALETSQKHARKEGIDEVMDEHKLDVVVAPSNAPVWLTDHVSGDCGSGYVSSSTMPAVAGYPNITVPAGFIKELPIGISFFGRAYSEPTLIRVAYSFEQSSKARRKPRFLATAA